MDSKIKSVIKRIAKTDITSSVDMLGDVIADILFKDRKSALFVNNDNHTVLLLLPTNVKNKRKQESILRLIELLAILEKLERDGLIYVDDSNYLPVCFFYQSKELFEQDQCPGTYKVSKHVTLNNLDDTNLTLKLLDEELMSTSAVIERAGVPLARFLCSSCLPTRSLWDYVDRGFKTKEERNTQLGLRYSIISMTIAVLIALVSPIISVLTANRIGFSTIKREQMDSLINYPQPVFLVGDKHFDQPSCCEKDSVIKQNVNRNGK